jgi:cob(I)alamin adenosyltransferase
MKIYTKKGDLGQTSLLGGERVSKDHIRIEAYGTVDELNSQIGVVMCEFTAGQKELKIIQDQLFSIGSHLANSASSKFTLAPINKQWIVDLEIKMDEMTEQLSPLKNFVLPGSDIANAHCHVARCICRRAERLAVGLNQHEAVDGNIVKYLNRLSDYLFTLSRFITFKNGTKEIIWEGWGRI